RLREEDPVHCYAPGQWFLTRYDDVASILRDPRFRTSVIPDLLRARLGDGAAFAYVSRRLTSYDPPDHTRLRSLVTKAFTVQRIEGMRADIQSLADELLDSVQDAHQMDVIASLAHPLPSLVICEMLGVPHADRPRFSAWTEDIAFLIAIAIEPDRLAAGEKAAGEFMEYVRALITRRRAALGADLLSARIAAEQDSYRLSQDELVATVVFLFSAGHQTTRDLTGNGCLALLRHPSQKEQLASHPEFLVEAVEEGLRYDPSVTMTGRRAAKDATIRGRTIRAGDRLSLSISAANRDPAVFANPDRFDLNRPVKEHLSFGGGIHYCLGAALARAE